MQEKLQEETEKSTEGVAFLASEILDSWNILTVSHQTIEYLSLLSSSFALVISPLWQELAKQVAAQAQKLQKAGEGLRLSVDQERQI